ncbi:MAG: type II secretion system protein GspM [Pseudomonadota bacterium]
MKISINQLRDLVGQLDVLKAYYARLSERERYIVWASIAGGVLFFMFLIYSAFAVTTASMAGRIERNRLALRNMDQLKAQYIQTERQVREMELMIRSASPDFQLATHLEKLARKNGVSIESLKDRPAPSNEMYKETQVAVSVKQITLRGLINFLFDVENSQQLLRITSLQVKPNFQDPTQLNVNFSVSTFQPAANP